MVLNVRSVNRRRLHFEKQYTARPILRKVYRSMADYAGKNGGRLPLAEDWCDALMAFNSQLLVYDFIHPQVECIRLAFNENVAGQLLRKLDPNTAIIFLGYGGWNLHGGQPLLEEMIRNPGEYSYSIDERERRFPQVNRGVLILASGRVVVYSLTQRNPGFMLDGDINPVNIFWEI
jgi:hypothetical protein